MLRSNLFTRFVVNFCILLRKRPANRRFPVLCSHLRRAKLLSPLTYVAGRQITNLHYQGSAGEPSQRGIKHCRFWLDWIHFTKKGQRVSDPQADLLDETPEVSF